MSLGISPPCSYRQAPSPDPESLFDITGPSHRCFTIVFTGVWVKLEAAVCTFLKIAVHLPLIRVTLIPHQGLFFPPGPQKGDKRIYNRSLLCPASWSSALHKDHVCPTKCSTSLLPIKSATLLCLNPLPQTSFSTDQLTSCSHMPICSLFPLLPSSSFPDLSHHLLHHSYAPSLHF